LVGYFTRLLKNGLAQPGRNKIAYPSYWYLNFYYHKTGEANYPLAQIYFSLLFYSKMTKLDQADDKVVEESCKVNG